MKKFKLIISIAAMSAMAVAAPAAGFVNAQGNYLASGTNDTQVCAGTNAVVHTVKAATTNYFNLPGQSDTNRYPAISLASGLNPYPFRLLSLQEAFPCSGTNVLNVTTRVAVSTDNSHWITNAYFIAITANGTSIATGWTNFDLYAFPYAALQSIENPNGTVDATNLWMSAGFKPGI